MKMIDGAPATLPHLQHDDIDFSVLFDAILSDSDDCIKVLDLEGRLVFMSKGGQRVMEIDDFSDVQGCFWPDFWVDSGNAAARNAITSAAAGIPARFTGTASTYKGATRQWDVRVRPLLGPQGKPTHLLSISRDISEEHLAKAEVARREEDERNAAAKEADFLRRMLVDAPSFMAILTGHDHVFRMANRAFQQLVNHRDPTGRSVADALSGALRQVLMDVLEDVYATRDTVIRKGVTVALQQAADGEVTDAHVNFVFQPIIDEQGNVSGVFIEGSDVTDLKNAEIALRRKELQLQLALETAGMGVWECDVREGRLTDLRADAMALRFINRTSDQTADDGSVFGTVHPADGLQVSEAVAAALDLQGDGVLDVVYRVVECNGITARWLHARAKRVTFGEDTKLIGTVRDISEIKAVEARQQMVSGELQHRIKNLLAMVSAIATQTLRGDDIADRRDVFSARLHVLAQAQNMLVSTTTENAGIDATIAAALAPHGVSDGRFAISGPAFAMTAKQSMSMALTLHELATNAMKYGALSNDTGKVDICWTLTPDIGGRHMLEFVWRERGGPLVSKPASNGFGSRLISRVLAADFNGEVVIDYLADGVVCTLKALLAGDQCDA